MSEPFPELIPPAIHGGNIHAASRATGQPIDELIDFSASINPLGLPSSARRALVNAIPACIHYPDRYGDELRKQIGQNLHIDPESIVLGNGSVELIAHLPRALAMQHGLVLGPTFMEFERALILNRAQCTYLHARPSDHYVPPVEEARRMLEKQKAGKQPCTRGRQSRKLPIDGVFVCNPNSPTGQGVGRSRVKRLLQTVEQVKGYLIVDEAFVDFCESLSVLKHVPKSQRLVVIRSFTKFFSMPGLRIGYLVGPPDVIARLRMWLPPWTVNNLAQATALAVLKDIRYRRRSLALIRQERGRLMKRLKGLPGIRLFPSQANFLLLELPSQFFAARVADWCRVQGLLVRPCTDFSGMNARYLRVAIRLPKENDKLVRVLRRALVSCS